MKIVPILLAMIGYTHSYDCPFINKTVSTDRRIDKENLRIVQFNAEWLFVDHYSEFNCPGSCTWVNESEAKIHLDYISKVVKILNPDILNLCEVEGCNELNMVISSTDTTYLPYLKQGTDTSTGQNVAMITKLDPLIDLYRSEERAAYPINESSCGYTGPSGTVGVSKHYITEYKWYQKNVAFISAHLLAYPADVLRCAEREAQAQVLQSVIYNYHKKGFEIIIMGDFNDYDSDLLDLNNNKPLSQVLNILKGKQGLLKNEYNLISAAEFIPKEKRFSDWYDENANCVSSTNEFSMIDHVLVSPFLYDKIKNVYIYQEYAEFCGKYNSDHYPVVIELDGNI